MVKQPENLRCTCLNTYCEWHGKCKECVALHRHFGKHIPACLQPILRDKITAVAETVELQTTEYERTTPEHWKYVHERDSGLDI